MAAVFHTPRKAPRGAKRRPRRVRDGLIALAVGILAGTVMGLLGRLDLVRTFELKTLDLRFRVAGQRTPRAPVVIVFIGDDSIKKVGRWPWDWEYHALLVDILGRAGARQVIFDILFAESPGAGQSRLFAATTKLGGNVHFCSHFASLSPGSDGSTLIEGRGLTEPIAELAAAAAGVGHCNAMFDVDGNARRIPLVVRTGERLYPAAPFRAALAHLGASPGDVRVNRAGDLEVPIPGRAALRIPLDAEGQTLVNYLGNEKAFPSYSYHQVLQADQFPGKSALDLGVFKDKIVLVGVTFAGNTDLRPSPFSATNPMVCTLATVVDNVIGNDFLRDLSAGRARALLLGLGALAGVVAYALRPLPSFIILNITVLICAIGAQAAFSVLNLNVPVVTPVLTVVGTYLFVTAARFVREERAAREVRRLFSNYSTEQLVDLIVEHPHLARLGGERRQVTVLFADIVGFTNFAERHPAEEVVALLNDYLGEMTDIVFRWDGTLDKFVGDAVVAFWGAPVAQPNHGELALRCALHMIRRVEELQQRWTAAGWSPLCVGIGLNTGEVIVGNIGAEGKKMDYTVIGDPVNLGARVESLTRKLECHLLITDFTLEQVRELVAAGGFGHLRIAGRGEVDVKGKQARVNVFQVDVRAQGAAAEFQL